MEVAMTEKALNSLLALEISQETMQTIQQHPLYPQMLQLCKMMTRNKGIMETLNNAPLKTLQDLQVIAVCHKMREPIIIIEEAIQTNLRAQQWARGLKNLRQAMEKRLAEQESDKDEC